MLRKWWLIVLCSFFIFGCSHHDTVLHDSQGQQTTVEQLKNKWVIINYWASWCEACVEEIPELNRFYHDNKDHSIVMYGVNFDGPPPSDLMNMIKENHIDYPVLFENPTDIWHLGSLDMIPTTFIINPEGKIVKTMVGGLTEESLSAALKELQA